MTSWACARWARSEGTSDEKREGATKTRAAVDEEKPLASLLLPRFASPLFLV